jgi:hypothetical protein
MPLEFRLKDFSLDVPGPNNLGKNTWAEDELPTLPSIQTILTNARRAFEINAELKILNGMAKKHDDSVSTYSAEQKAALSEFHLTGSSRLYFSPPRTVHYADRNKAIEEGVIDSYTRYRVRFYSLGLTGISFRSGNEFVKRYCKVQNAAGEEVKVPTLMDAFTCTFEPAQIGPRMVKSPGDVIMEKYATKWLYDKGAKTGGPIAVSEAVKKLEGEIAEFQQTLRPLVMQIGCSGLLPAEYEEAAPDAALTGPDVMAMQTMLFTKAAGSNGQGFHQDAFYIPTFPDSLLGAWIAIDRADEENGCLWMTPGTNHEPIYPPKNGYGYGDVQLEGIEYVANVGGHSNDDEDPLNTLKPIADRFHDREVPCVMEPGDVAFFGGHVLHRSLKNRSADRYRRSFVNHYANARSYTIWGGGNREHILARGNTHLEFAQPRFGTPCAASGPERSSPSDTGNTPEMMMATPSGTIAPQEPGGGHED